MEQKHYYVKSAIAFLETIGHACPVFTDQYHAADYWTDNQEEIAKSIANFSDGNKQIAAELLRLFGTLSRAARYFNELNTQKS